MHFDAVLTSADGASSGDWYELSVGPSTSLAIRDQAGRLVGNDSGEVALEIPGSFVNIPAGVVPGEGVEYPESYVLSSSTRLSIEMIYVGTGQPYLYGLLPGGQVQVSGGAVAGGPAARAAYAAGQAPRDLVLAAPDAVEPPSMELLEFLGDWESKDGEWLDPLQLLDELEAEAQNVQVEGQSTD